MAPASNWLSFSLSPMEMLRSSESQYITYESSSTASPHYLIDNFYANGNPALFFRSITPFWSCLAAEKLWAKEGYVLVFFSIVLVKLHVMGFQSFVHTDLQLTDLKISVCQLNAGQTFLFGCRAI
jgi:hypothetical protein